MDFCLIGAGFIGPVHAANIAAHPGARLRSVFDLNHEAAERIVARHGSSVAASLEAALADKDLDAVVICTPPRTHAPIIEAAAKAGKAIFCEKPIDLSLKRVDQCLAEVEKARVPMFVGFNRRFDPSFRALHNRLAEGEIGLVEQVIISSRDPGLPPLSYLKVSGGQFRDMTIHDFDMARWLLGEEPVEVFATGSALVDPQVGKLGDIDSAMVIMRTASGKLCHINNSRRATYGYDQRIEVHGSKGRLMASNHVQTSVELANEKSISTDKPLYFFLERYAEAYRAELSAFLLAVKGKKRMPVGAEDGRQALVLAEAALVSLKTKAAVKVKELEKKFKK